MMALSFSSCCGKITSKATEGERAYLAHNSRLWSILARKSPQWQEPERAAHSTSPLKRRSSKLNSAQLAPVLYRPAWAPRDGPNHSEDGTSHRN